MSYAEKIVWSGGYRENTPTCLKDCCHAEFNGWSLWVEILKAESCHRWVWTVDEGPDEGNLRSVVNGIEPTEAKARVAAEKAARRLARPRLRVVA